MSAVVKAVENVVGAAVDVVEGVAGGVVDIVEDVVGVVADAVDWVVDEVVEPVVSGVGDVIDYALDNPIEALATLAVTIGAPYLAPYMAGAGASAATVAATTASIQAAAQWVIPLASGTQTLVNGGDIGDAVKSAAVSFATTYAGKAIGTAVDPTIANVSNTAISNTKLASSVSQVVSGATKSATKTFVRTGDLKAAGNAFVNASALGGINAGLEAATDAVIGNIDQALQDSGFGKEFNELAGGIKESIYTSVAAEITGQDVSAQSIINALDSDGFITNIVDKFAPVASFMDELADDAKARLGKDLSDTQVQLLSDAVSASWEAVKAGNPDASGEEFFGSLQEEAYEQLIDTISDPIDSALDKLTGNTAKAEAAATPLNEALAKTAEATSGYNTLREELNGRVQEQERLKDVYNQAVTAFNADKNQDTQSAANAASAAYNEYVIKLTKDYNDTYKPQMDAYMATYNEYEPTIATLEKEYEEASTYVISDIEDLDSSLKPMLEGVNKVVATTLRPGIDEAEYRRLNGLGPYTDIYKHYLQNQKIAQVFDVVKLNEEASGFGNDVYGEGYTVETRTETVTDPVDGSTYDEYILDYYVDTPDGKVKVDPYLEGIGGGRGGDPRDFNDGVWSMSEYRKKVAPPVTLGGRLSYDMAVILGDKNKQGQIVLLEDFKKLKDAGYTITAFKDPFTGQKITGDKEYSEILAESVDAVRNKGYTPVDISGYTTVTQDLHNDVIGFWESEGYSNEKAIEFANTMAPVGGILDTPAEIGGPADAAAFRDYLDTLDTPDGEEGKYSFNENLEQIQIAEAARLTGGEPLLIEAFLQNTAGLGLDAIGQLAQTMSYATILTNAAGLTDTSPQKTFLADFGKILSETGQGIQTDEYREKVKNLNEEMAKSMQDAEGFSETLGALARVATNNPTAFFSEYIVSELFQELPLLVASGGTSLLLKGGLKVTAKTVGKEFSENMLKRAGLTAAVGTAGATNLAEGYGGAAQDGYEKGLSTYNSVTFKNLINQGLSASEAQAALKTPEHIEKSEAYAANLGEQAGLIGGGIALITGGLVAGKAIDNLALEKALFGDKKAPAGFIDELKEFATIVGRESVAEGGEELGISAFIEGRLSLIDPTRDVSGNNTAAALLGTLTGGTTTGGILVGSKIVTGLSPEATVSVLAASPEQQQKMLGGGAFLGPTSKESTSPGYTSPPDTPTQQDIKSTLEELGANTDTINEVVNITYDAETTTKQEVKEYVELENPEFEFTDEGYKQFVGTDKPDANLATEVAAYIDPRYFDLGEIKATAAAEGITLTDEQAKEYEGQKDEAAAVEEIIAEYDPQATTYEEAKKYLDDLGYEATDEEINTFVGQVNETEQEAAISAYVDPRQTTEAEVRKAFADQGYDPTDAEVAERVGQGGDTFAADTTTDVDTYVDPRQVTAEEVTDAYAELGLTRPTDDDIQALVGQYMETDLAGKAEESLPTARYNSIINILDNLTGNTGETGVSDDVKDAIDVVKSDMIDALGDLGLEVANIDKAVTDIKDAVGALPEGASSEDVSNAIDAALKDMNNLSAEDVSGIVNTALADMDTLSSEDVQGIVDTALEELPAGLSEGDVETIVNDAIGSPEAVDENGDVVGATGVYADIADLNNLSSDEVKTIVNTALEALPEGLNSEDVSSAIDTALEGLENLSADDVDTAITDALADMNNLSSEDVEGIVDTAVKDVTETVGTLETDLTKLIKDNAGDVDTALEELAGNLDTTEEALLAELNTTKEELETSFTEGLEGVTSDIEDVSDDVGDLTDIIGTAGVVDDPDTDIDETQDPTGLFATIKTYEDAGLDRDEALQKAIGDVAGALNTTKTDLLLAVGETETSLSKQITDAETNLGDTITEGDKALGEQITDVETQLTELIKDNETAGLDRDEAIQTALGTLSTEFGVGKTDLLNEIGKTEADLLGEIGDVKTNLGADIDAVADLIGKPARDVTQTDIDFVIDLIAQENVNAELTAQYDVTGDGIVDLADQTLLETALQGEQDVTLADTSMFNPATGVYAQIDAQTDTITDMLSEYNTELNTRIDTQNEELAAQDKQERVRALLDAEQQGMFSGARASVNTPGPMNIDYLYDIGGDSVFATPQQAGLFSSPYGPRQSAQPANSAFGPQPRAANFVKGGQVEDDNDRLLRMLGEI